MPASVVLIRRIYRTGVQIVEREGSRYFLTLHNRTNNTKHEVPVAIARRYYRKMKEGG